MKDIRMKIQNYSYDEQFCIGQGSYGKVFLGKNDITNEQVAIKKINLSQIQDEYMQTILAREVEIIKLINHPNVVKCIDLFQSTKCLYLITEYCKDGDLSQKLQNGPLSETESLSILFQILNGFQELYKNQIIHRDLKPANILAHNDTYKITDFGFARIVSNYASEAMQSKVGSPLYMAPQILLRQQYTIKCDIWSLGQQCFQKLLNYRGNIFGNAVRAYYMKQRQSSQ